MGMKGHAIFELTNTETGEKRVYEDDNMVTNFLEQFCIPTGQLNYSLQLLSTSGQYASSYGIVGSLLNLFTKGLLLFEDEVDEDADNIWPRNGNKVIGQGASGSYSGANTKVGSYNETESGPVENGYRHVWDFSTAQANGQISCACLTTPTGGSLGNGNSKAYSDFTGTPTKFLGNRSYDYSYYSGELMHIAPILVDYEKDCAYTLMGQCTMGSSLSQEFAQNQSILYKKEIRIRREKFYMLELSIFDDLSGTPAKSKFEDLVFPMPQEVIDSCDYDSIYTLSNCCNSRLNTEVWMNSWGKHIYLHFTTTNITISNKTDTRRYVNTGDDLVIVDIDVEAETCTAFKVKNTTGSTITYSRDYSRACHRVNPSFTNADVSYARTSVNYPAPIFVTDKYVMIHADNGKLYRVSRADNTEIKEFCYEDNTESYFNLGSTDASGVDFSFLPLGKNAEQFNKNRVVGYRSNNNIMFMFDFENATYGILSKSVTGSDFFDAKNIIGTDLICFSLSYQDSNRNSWRQVLGGTFPTMLTTINNLDSPVLKTSADTMKVTYIITNGDV